MRKNINVIAVFGVYNRRKKKHSGYLAGYGLTAKSNSLTRRVQQQTNRGPYSPTFLTNVLLVLSTVQ